MAFFLRRSMAACAVAGAMWAEHARAQEAPEPVPAPAPAVAPTGLRMAARAGGSAVVSNERSTGLTETIPIRIDLLRRSDKSVFDVGTTFELGPAWVELVGYPATGMRGRVGVLGVAHFRKARPFDPWLGMGGGVEFRMARGGRDQVHVDYDRIGLELARLELGADVPLGDRSKLAPTIEAAFGRYLIDTATPSNPMGLEVHATFGLGVRGSYDF